MIITFRCNSAADVIMLSKHAEPILKLAGKALNSEFGRRGQLHHEQLDVAIQHLEYALKIETPPPSHLEADDEHDDIIPDYVSLRQRAFPLLDLMRHAKESEEFLTWE